MNAELTNIVPLVKISRGDIECDQIHLGGIAVVNRDAELLNKALNLGENSAQITACFRSSAKPLQFLPAILEGAIEKFSFTNGEVAVICASHSGEIFHQKALFSIIKKTGIPEEKLACGIHPPFHKKTQEECIKSGTPYSVYHHNCSGNHLGILITSKLLALDLDNYYASDHLVHLYIRNIIATLAKMSQEQIKTASDGCGIPTFAVSLQNAAISFANLIDSKTMTPKLQIACKTVVQSMIMNPEYLGSSENWLDSDIIKLAQGKLVAKCGASGFYTFAISPEDDHKPSIGVAIKIADGNSQVRDLVVIEMLSRLGVFPPSTIKNLKDKYAPSFKDPKGKVIADYKILF